MKKRLQGMVVGVLLGAMLTGGAIYAKEVSQYIQVYYNNIRVYKDKQLYTLSDANGNRIDPFIYNGTTYLPVRAVANLAGMKVTWDDATKSVYLWQNMVPGAVNLLDACPPYDYKYCSIYPSGKYLDMSGAKYTNGVELNTTSSVVYFNLGGKYSTLDCTIGHSFDDYAGVDKTVTFKVDGKTVMTVNVPANCMPGPISVPLNYGRQLEITLSGSRYVGIMNMIVQ